MLTDLASALRSKGMRVTPQRLAVLEAVARGGKHPCAEEVYRRVREAVPNISLATVYKALNDLRGVGELKAVAVSGKIRYDVTGRAPHHHMICEACREVTDVEADEIRLADLPKPSGKNFRVLETEVIYRGICRKCERRTERPVRVRAAS